MADQQPLSLLSVAPEIRLHIYSYLIDDGGEKWLPIRNLPYHHSREAATRQEHNVHSAGATHCPAGQVRPRKDAPRRTTYHVTEQTSMFHRRCFRTTYHLASSHSQSRSMQIHPAILAVCRLTYHEASHVLYGRHFFDFDRHIEAVVPFLADRTPLVRPMITTISVYKKGPLPCLGCTGDRYEWSYMCRFLAELRSVQKLRLVVEGGRPAQPWEGVQQLSQGDIRLLSLVGHESLEWVTDLAKVKTLDELELVPEIKYLPVPRSTAMVLYAALSASNEGLMDFLRAEMQLRK